MSFALSLPVCGVFKRLSLLRFPLIVDKVVSQFISVALLNEALYGAVSKSWSVGF